MINDFFSKIWRDEEKKYSSIIAQTLGLSKCFRDFFENSIGVKNAGSEITTIETEKDWSDFGQIDVFIKYDNDMVVAIENKKQKGLQPRQLHRYDEALKNESGNYKLVFLTPSNYVVPDNQKPKGLITLIYKEIIRWIKSTTINSEFENRYLQYLLPYIEPLEGVWEMSILENKEIESLLYVSSYQSCGKKLNFILNKLRKKDDRAIEKNPNYKLLHRMIKDFPIYIGIRFGTNWYYNAELLNNLPECLIYIKDIWWGKPEREDKNKLIQDIFDKLKADEDLKNEKIYFYPPGNRKEECRLAIKRLLQDFKDEHISKLIDWFSNIIKKLEDNINTS